jgi:hypothetical protein
MWDLTDLLIGWRLRLMKVDAVVHGSESAGRGGCLLQACQLTARIMLVSEDSESGEEIDRLPCGVFSTQVCMTSSDTRAHAIVAGVADVSRSTSAPSPDR